MVLIARLESKAQAGVSNPSLVTQDLMTAAMSEADELIGNKIISDTVKLDIAYFRLMLMIKKDSVSDLEVELYDKAIKSVKSAPSQVEGEVVHKIIRVGQRKNSWT